MKHGKHRKMKTAAKGRGVEVMLGRHVVRHSPATLGAPVVGPTADEIVQQLLREQRAKGTDKGSAEGQAALLAALLI